MGNSAIQSWHVPWAAWHGDTALELKFPATCTVNDFQMADAPALSDSEIATALKRTIGTESICQLVSGRKSVAIAVDDLSRPTPSHKLLPFLLSELLSCGVEKKDIKIIVSLGAHTRLGVEQLKRKLGKDVVAEYTILNHDAHSNLAPSGAIVGKTEVRINKDFLDSDLKIIMGSVVPHHFAGFSGGAKMILPGLSDLGAIAWTHKAVLMGLRSKVGSLKGNRFRKEFESVAATVGIDLSINVVVNAAREVCGLFSGDFIAAHREAAECAARVYKTPAAASLDVAIFNCYPKDTELIQAENAFMFMHSAPEKCIHEKGTVVVASACSEGMGEHGLFDPEGVLYRKPVAKRFLADRHLVFYSTGISRDDFYKIYWEGYDFCSSWDEVLQILDKRHGPKARMGIFPNASIQIAASETD